MHKFKTNYTIMVVDNAKQSKADTSISISKSFFKDLGLKTDKYGWLRVSDDILDVSLFNTILKNLNNENCKLRLNAEIYVEKETDIEWYLLEPYYAFMNYLGVPNSNIGMNAINTNDFNEGLYLVNPSDIEPGTSIIAREDTLKLLKNDGVNISIGPWIPDISKYKAQQFYYWTIEDNLMGGSGIKNGKVWQSITMRKQKMENYLSVFNEVLPIAAHYHPDSIKFEELSTPFIVEKRTLEKSEVFRVGSDKICVSNRVRNTLIDNKIIDDSKVSPIIVVDDYSDLFPDAPMFKWRLKEKDSKHKYVIEAEEKQKYRKKLYDDYIKTGRPERKITQKMALDRLREAKASNPEDFNKGAKDCKLDLIEEQLRPYYKFANGFSIDGEYYIFPIEEISRYKLEFENDRKYEMDNGLEKAAFIADSKLNENDFIMQIPNGYTVIGNTADGEWIIMLPSGKVGRYGLFNPEFVDSWNSIQDFFYYI